MMMARRVSDFGDGGAFPEIHYAQYPLDMGRKKYRTTTLPVTVDDHGEVRYGAIVRQGENAKKIVYCQHKDLVPKHDGGLDLDVEEQEKKIHDETKAAIEKIMNVAQPTKVQSNFIKYKPSASNKSRIIRMADMQVDPIDPPKFKRKKVPRASGSPPVPLMHSPPRPVTVKDQQDWKIPPCISNWKNPNGYTIPLDKRIAADGTRGILQEVQVNDNLAKLSEALYVAEEKARVAVAMRSKVQKEMMIKEKEKKEMELRELAQKARSERSAPMNDMGYESAREDRLQRKKICEERRRERRLEETKNAKKIKITRDRDRDISEKVALGMASTSRGGGEIMMYDQRLFNQQKGMGSGFASTDDAYNIYDKGLFTAHQPTLSTLYRPKKDVDIYMYGGELEKIIKKDRFKPDTAFVGTFERAGPRDRPVEFDADPFGLDQLWGEVINNKAEETHKGST